MASAISGLSTAGSVSVSRSVNGNGFTWLVTFSAPKLRSETFPLLFAGCTVASGCSDSSITTRRASPSPDLSVSGTFRLLYKNVSTPALEHSASASDVKAALTSLPGIGTITVTANTVNPVGLGGKSWTVDFVQNTGNLDALEIDASSLVGCASISASVTTVHDGQSSCCMSGTFILGFGSESTQALPYDISAGRLRVELEKLSSVSLSAVTRTTTDVNGGHAWNITFAGYQDQGSLSATPFLSGSNAQAVVADVCDGFAAEEQTLTLSSTSPVVDGTFALSFRGQATSVLRHNATSGELEAALNALSTIGEVSVARSDQTDVSSFSWVVTFVGNVGTQPALLQQSANNLMALTSSVVSIDVTRTRSATSVASSGSFAVDYDGHTATFNVGVSAIDVQNAFNGFSTLSTALGTVSVSRGPTDYNGDFSYSITFPGANLRGDRPDIILDTTNLQGTGNHLSRVYKAQKGSYLDGTFTLSYGGNSSVPIEHDAKAEDVKSALSALSPELSGIEVTRTLQNAGGGFTWQISYSGVTGDVKLVQADASNLLGTDARVEVAETVAGANPLSGHFRLSFRGQSTALLPNDATAQVVEDALESLSSVGDVTVARVPVTGGYAWQVNFTTNGQPENVGNLPLLVVDQGKLVGAVAEAAVGKTQAGCCHVGVSLNGENFAVSSQATLRFDRRTFVRVVIPVSGPLHGGSPVRVQGSGFSRNGQNFCLFGTLKVTATFVSSSELECVSPAARIYGQVLVRTSHFAYMDRAASVSNSSTYFRYDPVIRITHISPAHGPVYGGGLVDVYGAGFVNSSLLTCKFGSKASSSAHFVNGTRVRCAVPALGVDEMHMNQTHRVASLAVEISNNGGVDFSTSNVIYDYREPAHASALRPSSGPSTGGSVVEVTGVNFYDASSSTPSSSLSPSSSLLCKFGNTTVGATLISDEAIRCVAPPHSNVFEVQDVVVTAPLPSGNVQKIKVSPTTQGVAASGSFALVAQGATTASIAFSAGAGPTIESRLEALDAIHSDVSVSASSTDARGVVSWLVTFGPGRSPGQLVVDATGMSNARVTAEHVVAEDMQGVTEEAHKITVQASAISREQQKIRLSSDPYVKEVQRIILRASDTMTGSISIAYGGSSAQTVANDASAMDMQAAVQACDPSLVVDVTRAPADGTRGFIWDITFKR